MAVCESYVGKEYPVDVLGQDSSNIVHDGELTLTPNANINHRRRQAVSVAARREQLAC